MLTKIKILLGISNTDKDGLLQVLIDDCMAFTVDYCNLLAYDTKLDSVVSSMVMEKYNKLGAEGINSRSFSGISESYNNDYSEAIYRQLNKNRKLKTL